VRAAVDYLQLLIECEGQCNDTTSSTTRLMMLPPQYYTSTERARRLSWGKVAIRVGWAFAGGNALSLEK
jgi:hypothetical protein